MSRAARATVTVLVAAVLVRLSVTGASKRYVRSGMTGWLLVAGVVLALLGAWSFLRADRPDDDHDHGAGRIGWLLLAPIAALLLVAPPSLGSWALARTGRASVTSTGRATFRALRGDGPVPMTLLELNERATQDGAASFGSVPVSLVAFVASDGGDLRVARYQIACCAADAVASEAFVDGLDGRVERDDWVRVTGTFGGVRGGLPVVEATEVEPISAPEDPYE